MKKILYSLLLILIASSFLAQAQEAAVKIDGQLVYLKAGNSLPYWLKAGQSIAPSKNVSFLSGIEFNSDSTNHVLKYDQVIKIASLSTVPAGKVWKIEAIAYDTLMLSTSIGETMLPNNTTTTGSAASASSSNTPALYKSPKIFDIAGSYQWMVPPGVTSICVEIWGGGGNGGRGGTSNCWPGGGGGGGGYGYQCFSVVPGTIYNLIVGGSAAQSSFSTLISANGGTNGGNGATTVGGAGTGGSSNAVINFTGKNGAAGSTVSTTNYGGAGGYSYNGGLGAITNSSAAAVVPPMNGESPGGGGSGGSSCSQSGGAGAPGQVIIYW